jgi:hypothetical protein
VWFFTHHHCSFTINNDNYPIKERGRLAMQKEEGSLTLLGC